MKHLKKLLLGLFLMLSICTFRDTDVHAATLLAEKTKTCSYLSDITYKVSLEDSSLFYITFDLNIDEISDGKQGISVRIKGYTDKKAYNWDKKPIYRDSFKLKIPKNDKELGWWITSGPFDAGYYVVEITSLDILNNIKVHYKIWEYPCYAASATLPKTINVKTYSYQQVKISKIKPKGALLGDEISVDKEDIAEVWTDGAGEIQIYGKKAGKCKLTLKLDNGKEIKCNIIVTNPPPFLNYTGVTMCMSDTFNLELMAAEERGVSWSSSNTKIAMVDSNGKVTAKSIGRCNIVAKYNGKTYTAVITVVRQNPDFAACIDGYYTRDNYFAVRIYNYSNKPLTIYSKNAIACNFDYKTYDRTLRFAKNAQSVIINPKEKKKIYFFVNGYTTWYDYKDFWIQYNFLFDGQQYMGKMYSNLYYSEYKNGAGYYYTYWQ